MKNTDILARLHDRSMTSDEAWSLHDAVMAEGAVNWHEILMLSPFEHKAFCSGVDYDELAKWRYDGWPNTCQICGEPIDIEREHWLARSKGGRAFGLAHIACLPVQR